MALSTGVKRLGCGCNPGHAGVTGSIPTTVENCGLYILGRLSVTSAQVASRQGGGGLGGLPLFMCPHVIIIQACVSRPQTAPPSQGAGPMGGILWRYGAKGGPNGLLLLLLLCNYTDAQTVHTPATSTGLGLSNVCTDTHAIWQAPTPKMPPTWPIQPLQTSCTIPCNHLHVYATQHRPPSPNIRGWHVCSNPGPTPFVTHMVE
jgi:hypothetical protein